MRILGWHFPSEIRRFPGPLLGAHSLRHQGRQSVIYNEVPTFPQRVRKASQHLHSIFFLRSERPWWMNLWIFLLEISNWPEDPLQGGLQQIIPKAPCGLALARMRQTRCFANGASKCISMNGWSLCAWCDFHSSEAEKSENTKECAGFVC